MPLESSPESPLPVRTVARSIGEWVARLGRVWVEGQVTDTSRRPGMGTVFLTLRDPVADVSLRVSCARDVCERLEPPLADGARVVVWAKPDFWLARGSLSLTAFDIRPVGVGELLARLERLRRTLATEGLFAAERKARLPFLPRTVGLICGRDSAAEHDVLENARRRWPGVEFAVRTVAVQGHLAVPQVMEALRELDRSPDVDVIVIARGGGSLEDLLPFSDEALCRAVADCRTPVVSAIGHESDTPLLDLVADVRASTPTDAAKKVVPDVAEELQRVVAARDRARRVVTHRVAEDLRALAAVRSRPVLAAPERDLDRRTADLEAARSRAHRSVSVAVESGRVELGQLRARVAALSPQATLERGYAVVQLPDGAVVRDADEVAAGEAVTVRVARGRFVATRTNGDEA